MHDARALVDHKAACCAHWFRQAGFLRVFHEAVRVEDLQPAVVVGLDKPNDLEEVDVTDPCYLFQHCIDHPLPAFVCKPVHEGQGHHDTQERAVAFDLGERLSQSVVEAFRGQGLLFVSLLEDLGIALG